ncbi:hypothetical protein AGRI_09385 [Alishewanella agri BL06]|mgnify:FL=1|jgi:uncharacterized membrane protein|uniref:DUF599 domain-containing protein n=1 Tax=Alishewanella agri BL06 TaxID=1195246 RepID=I9P2I1_9ALTE|nr:MULTISPECIES: DUF599 family protein [Alishewanella]EIW88989.1 hypothetical protein AGRI_09385 [Alishewanella agri BL06]KRS21321.1 membrane protein [Alishewanella sp. WH16-1]OZB39135.1 MAG: hypothetical protein B7X50_10050 [Alishewanella sp. 34-51-39]
MLSWVDILALGWFSLVWSGYTLYAKRKAKVVSCLSFEMRRKRNHWMQQMLRRDNKMADVGLISTLERNVSFFASSCLLILAGLLTVLTSSERLSHVLSGLIPWSVQSETQIQVKILLLAFIYVFGFFQFTWSLRQYGFGGVLIGAAPDGKALTDEEQLLYANRTAKVIDQAGHSFNYGLRAIYFSLAALTWFIDAWIFMVVTVLVVLILKQREFHSKILKALQEC